MYTEYRVGGRGLGGFLSKEPTEEYNKQNKYTLLISSLGGAGLQLGFVAVGNLENRLFFLRYSFLSGAAVFCPGGGGGGWVWAIISLRRVGL